MAFALYLEVDFLCVLILAGIYSLLQQDVDRRVETVAFGRIVFAVIGVLLADISWTILEGHTDPPACILLSNVTYTIYMVLSGLVGYRCLIYTDCVINRSAHPSFLSRFFQSLPFWFLAILAVSSPWTHALFYVGDGNTFQDGKLFFVQRIVAYGYLSVSAIRISLRLPMVRSRFRRVELLTVLSFFVFPAVAILPDIFIGDTLPLIWPATTLAILMVFVSLQIHQILTDALTGLNNRRNYDKYLSALSPRATGVYLLLMDLNFFKKINDVCGHVRGDCALVATADILRVACSNERAFIARVGGDEFAIVYTCVDMDCAELLKRRILDGFGAFNAQNKCSIPLSLSIGIAEYKGSVSDMIALADERLYEEKRRIHAIRKN